MNIHSSLQTLTLLLSIVVENRTGHPGERIKFKDDTGTNEITPQFFPHLTHKEIVLYSIIETRCVKITMNAKI